MRPGRVFFMGAVTGFFLLLGWVLVVRGEVAECIVLPRQGLIQTECDTREGYDGGCSQRLAKYDWDLAQKNWYSTDYPNGEAMMGQVLWCDIPTQYAFRGAYKIQFSQGSHWLVAKMRVEPGTAVAELEENAEGSSYYFDEWHCSKTDGHGHVLEDHDGSYARELGILGQFPSDSQLYGISDFEFIDEPRYYDAYYQVVEGYLDIRGWASNSHPPNSDEAAEEAWQKRWAVFDLMARGDPLEPKPTPEEPWWSMVKVSEYMLKHYIHGETVSGWPTFENQALTLAVDQIYRMTVNGVDPSLGLVDPEYIFQDDDVPVERTTIGQIKWMYRDLPRIELTR